MRQNSDDPARPHGRRAFSPAAPWLAFAGACAMASAFGFNRFVYTPILPHMAAEAGLSATQTGLIASANFLGYLLGALMGVLPAFRRRVYGAFAVGLLGGVGGMLALSVDFGAATFAAACALRFFGGMVGAFVIVCLGTLVAEPILRAGRPGLASAPFAGVGCGIAASSVLAERLVAQGADWRQLWLAAGLAALALAALALAIVRPQPAPAPAANAPGAVPAGGRRGALMRLIVSYGLFGFGYVITATFIVAIARETPALAPVAPWVWTFVGLAGAVSIAFWSLVSARIGVLATYRVAMLTEALGVALTVLVPSPLAILAGGAMLGGTFMAITAWGFALAREIEPAGAQRLQAVLTAAFGLGQIAGPLAAGFGREATGSYVWPSLAAAALLLVATVLPARK